MEVDVKKLKQLIILGILALLLPIAILGLKRVIEIRSRADIKPTAAKTSNIGVNSFAVSFFTADSTIGKLIWGTSKDALVNTTEDDRAKNGESANAKAHHISVDVTKTGSQANTQWNPNCNPFGDPCVSITVVPENVTAGSNVELRYFVHGQLTNLGISGPGGYIRSVDYSEGNHTEYVNNVQYSGSYTISGITSDGQNVSDSHYLTVQQTQPSVTSFNADRTQINVGESVTFSWTTENATSAEFVFTNCTAGTCSINVPVNGSRTQQYTAPGSYTYKIRAAGPGGTAESNPVTITIAQPCLPPSNVDAVRVSGSSIQVAWNTSLGANSYNVEFQKNNDPWTWVITNINISPITHNYLAPGDYRYRVYAICSGSSSAASNTSQTVTLEQPTTPPTASPAPMTFNSTCTKAGPGKGNYSANWSAFPGATSYHLQVGSNGARNSDGTLVTADFVNNSSIVLTNHTLEVPYALSGFGLHAVIKPNNSSQAYPVPVSSTAFFTQCPLFDPPSTAPPTASPTASPTTAPTASPTVSPSATISPTATACANAANSQPSTNWFLRLLGFGESTGRVQVDCGSPSPSGSSSASPSGSATASPSGSGTAAPTATPCTNAATSTAKRGNVLQRLLGLDSASVQVDCPSPSPSGSSSPAPTEPPVPTGFTRIYYKIQTGNTAWGGTDLSHLVENGPALYVDIPTSITDSVPEDQCTDNSRTALPGCPDAAFGTVKDSNGAPVEDTLVNLTVTFEGITSAPLTAVTNRAGKFTINLGAATSQDFKKYHTYNRKQNATLALRAEAPDGRSATQSTTTATDKPLPDMTLAATPTTPPTASPTVPPTIAPTAPPTIAPTVPPTSKPTSTPVPPNPGRPARLTFAPDKVTITRVGQKFVLGITLDTGGRDTDGTRAVVLFNPTQLKATTIYPGTAYAEYPTSAKVIDNSNGIVKVSGISSSSSSFNGRRIFATVEFESLVANSKDVSVVKFDFSPDSTTDSNVADTITKTDILGGVNTALVSFNGTSPSPTPAGQRLTVRANFEGQDASNQNSCALLTNKTTGAKQTVYFDGTQTTIATPELTTGSSYAFVLKGDRNLSVQKTVKIQPEETVVDFGILPAGDIAPVAGQKQSAQAAAVKVCFAGLTGDDLVEGALDFSVMKQSMINQYSLGDLNGNTVVDVVDLSMLKKNLERKGSALK